MAGVAGRLGEVAPGLRKRSVDLRVVDAIWLGKVDHRHLLELLRRLSGAAFSCWFQRHDAFLLHESRCLSMPVPEHDVFLLLVPEARCLMLVKSPNRYLIVLNILLNFTSIFFATILPTTHSELLPF